MWYLLECGVGLMKAEINHWCVIRSAPREEERAELNLLRQGYNTFLPRTRRQVRHARKVQWRLAPLFPGYLFVSLDPAATAWRPILSTWGVAGLVRFGERPACMPPGLVERMRAIAGPDGLLAGAPDLQPGDQVRISGGAFDDWIGQVIALPDQERVSLLLKAAHRSVEVTIPRASTLMIRTEHTGVR